jgi:hypothetical protein
MHMKKTADKIRQKMEDKGVMNSAILAFLRAYELIASGSKGEVGEEEITPADSVVDYGKIVMEDHFDPDLLAQTVVIKLNGGLGTSMGLEKVKSLLEVRPGVAFLDLMARQILSLRSATGGDVRFLLMNSKASSDDTQDYLSKSVPELGDPVDLELLQNWAPKLERESLEPVNHPEGKPRQSIALYYYTATWNSTRKAHSTLFAPRPGSSDQTDKQARRHAILREILPPFIYHRVIGRLARLGFRAAATARTPPPPLTAPTRRS